MARAKTKPKVKIGISLDADLYDWLLAHTGAGREFSSISHALERSAALYQEESRHRKTRSPNLGESSRDENAA